MSESISVSLELKIRLHEIMNPGESYEDVIAKLINEHQEETESDLCDGWANRAKEAIAEYQRGETISESDMMKKYGIQ